MGAVLLLFCWILVIPSTLQGAVDIDRGGTERGETTWGRLPSVVRPTHYSVTWEPDIYTSGPPFNFQGEVDITIDVLQVTTGVYLNSVGLTIDGATLSLSLAPGSPVWAPDPVIERWKLEESLEFLEIFLKSDLYLGAKYIIHIEFSGTLYDSSSEVALYWDSFEEDGNTVYFVASRFHASMARRAFPCFDEPQFVATFDIAVGRKDPYHGLSHMPVNYTLTRPDSWEVDHFERTLPMPPLNVMVIVMTPLVPVTTTSSGGVQVNIHMRAAKALEADFVNLFAADALDFLADYTGIPFPLSKLDLVGLPNQGGAMQSWGLVTWDEDAIIYDTMHETYEDEMGLVIWVCHEIAHEYFGNLVVMKWWDDCWLNEGMATYFAARAMEHVFGVSWREYMQTQVFPTMDRFDSSNTSVPVRRLDIVSPWQAGNSFSVVNSYKGAAVMTMLQQIMGETSFQSAITRYLSTNSNGYVVTDDLFNSFTQQAEEDNILDTDGGKLVVKEKLQEWLDQTCYPVVNMSREGEDFALTQTLFTLPPDQLMPDSTYGYTWHVPVTYYDQTDITWETQTVDWLNRENKSLVAGLAPGLWAITDVQASGYHTVDYDDINYQLIVDALLRTDVIFPATNRAQFIHDAFAYSRTGVHLESRAMEMTRYLSHERSMVPWHTVQGSFQRQDQLLHKFPYLHNAMLTYWRQRTEHVFAELGWTNQPGDTNFDKQMRSVVLDMSCASEVQDCLDDAKARFDLMVANQQINIVPPDHRLTVYCSALAADHPGDWEAGLALYLAEDNLADRRRLLAGLACSSNITVMQDYIALTFDPFTIRVEDAEFANLAIAVSRAGRGVMWQYLDTSWRDNPFPPSVNKHVIFEATTNAFTKDNDILDLERFILQYPSDGDIERGYYENALRTGWKNNRWEDRNEDDLFIWFFANTTPGEEDEDEEVRWRTALLDRQRTSAAPRGGGQPALSSLLRTYQQTKHHYNQYNV